MTEQDSTVPQTINDELLIDIYANPILNSLVILIDRPFKQVLTGLELVPHNNMLLFDFGGDKRDLGDPLGADLLPYFLNRDKVKICQIDLATKKPVAVQQVPLTVRK